MPKIIYDLIFQNQELLDTIGDAHDIEFACSTSINVQGLVDDIKVEFSVPDDAIFRVKLLDVHPDGTSNLRNQNFKSRLLDGCKYNVFCDMNTSEISTHISNNDYLSSSAIGDFCHALDISTSKSDELASSQLFDSFTFENDESIKIENDAVDLPQQSSSASISIPQFQLKDMDKVSTTFALRDLAKIYQQNKNKQLVYRSMKPKEPFIIGGIDVNQWLDRRPGYQALLVALKERGPISLATEKVYERAANKLIVDFMMDTTNTRNTESTTNINAIIEHLTAITNHPCWDILKSPIGRKKIFDAKSARIRRQKFEGELFGKRQTMKR